MLELEAVAVGDEVEAAVEEVEGGVEVALVAAACASIRSS